jgi:hypothetical protein
MIWTVTGRRIDGGIDDGGGTIIDGVVDGVGSGGGVHFNGFVRRIDGGMMAESSQCSTQNRLEVGATQHATQRPQG